MARTCQSRDILGIVPTAFEFHVEFDDLFETVGKRAGNIITVSKWQVLSRLKEGDAPVSKNTTVSEGATHVSTSVLSVHIPPSEVKPFPDDDFHAPVEAEVAIDPAPIDETRRSTRTHRPTRCFLEDLEQEDIALAFQCDESMDYELELQEAMADTIAFAASSDPDNIMGHEAKEMHCHSRSEDGTNLLTQPYLIAQIISDPGLKGNTKTNDLPALSSKILNRETNAYSVHQCAQFSSDPKASHAQAVKQIRQYLMANRDKGIILRPDANMGLEDWVNADFCAVGIGIENM
eukprot:scaffold29281_cov64-Attheya_sp.AAC.1